MRLAGEIDAFLILQLRQLLMMAVAHNHGQCIPTHHILISAGTARHQEMFEGNIESLCDISQCLSLGSPRWNKVDELAERVLYVGGDLLLPGKGDNLVNRRPLLRIVVP